MSNSFLKSEAFFLLTLFLLIPLFLLLSLDFGVTWDEPSLRLYGNAVYEYYRSGFRSLFALDMWPMHYYGGLVDLLSTWFSKLYPSLDPYICRHFVNSVFGWLAVFITSLAARRHFGVFAGFLAPFFLVFSPRFFADCMNNPKDLPFATAGVLALAALMRVRPEFPYYSVRTTCVFVLALALAINIRIGGLLFLGYGAVAFGARLLLDAGRLGLRRWIVAITGFSLIAVLSLILGTLFWPWALQNPLTRPFEALAIMSHFPTDEVAGVLFDGRWFSIDALPWDYIPRWLLITAPLPVLAGALAGVLTANRETRGAVALLVFAVVFPVGYIIVTKAAVYDAARHVLFVIPPLTMLAAFGWSRLFVLVRCRIALSACLSALFLLGWIDPVRFWIVNHPNQIVYFNPLVGGIKGALLRYDLDYWNNSFEQAVHWLNATAERSGQPILYTSVYGGPSVIEARQARYPGLRYISSNHLEAEKSNFVIALLRGNAELLQTMLEAPNIAHAILVDGVPICLIFEKTPLDEARR
jgi:hypothetical protein